MPTVATQSSLLSRSNNFPAGFSTPLRAHISGPQAKLHRYSVATEKSAIGLGAYNPNIDTNYSYPGKASGSLIDLDYVKLYVDSARIKYFDDSIGSGNTIIPVNGYTNRIKVSVGSTVFKANGASYPRSSDLEADVQVGDVVYIRGVISATNVELTTFVQDFVADVVAATIGSAAADASNKATQSASSSQSQTAGTTTCVVISALSHTNYDGLITGDISETYTVEVTQASVGGDATTAVLKVTSASGNDNVASLTPAAFSSATSIGTRGLTATFVNTPGSCTGSDFVVGQKWQIAVAQAFTAPTGGTSAGTYVGADDTTYIIEYTRGGKLAPVQAIATPTTAPATATATSGGTIADATYYVAYTYVGGTSGETMVSAEATQVTAGGGASTLTVTSPAARNGSTQYNIYMGTVSGTLKKQAGPYTIGNNTTLTSYNASGASPPGSNNALGAQPNPTPPQITVSTSTGVDLSGPTSVIPTGSGTTWSAPSLAIGSKGVTWTPNGSAYAKTDKYKIVVTGQKSGAYKTLVLGHNLPTTPLDLTSATDLDLKLYAKKDGLLISKNRTESPPNVNYSASSTTFTTKSGITATDARWTAGTKYPVTSGTLLLEYREWVATKADAVYTIGDITTVETVLGTVHPDNPLAYGVYKALQNSNESLVAYTGVADPSDASSWNIVLEQIDRLDNVYGLVPLTNNATVLASYFTHVKDQSLDENGAYRVLWVNLQPTTSKLVVNSTKSTDGQTVLATLSDNPAVTGTQYTYLQVPAGNANFVTNGVAAGDVVRYLYTTDGFGASSYTEFTVDSVVNENTLVLKTAHSIAINTPQKVEVWHTNTKDQIVNDLIDQAEAYDSELVRVTWPDQLVDGSTTFDGYYIGCIEAGLISALPPHQGITNAQVVGVTDVPRSMTYLNAAQRRRLAEGGVWVLEKEPVNGYIYNRFATTTSITTLEKREEMIVRDKHAVLFSIRSQLAPYIGTTNVVESVLNQISVDIDALKSVILQSSFVFNLGAMITGLNVLEVRQHTTLKDRVVVTFELFLPYPVNRIVLTVVV